MKRDLTKAITEYRKKFYGTHSKKGSFYYSDLNQIVEMGGDLPIMVFNAMEAGFMIGYNAAKREKRKKA